MEGHCEVVVGLLQIFSEPCSDHIGLILRSRMALEACSGLLFLVSARASTYALRDSVPMFASLL